MARIYDNIDIKFTDGLRGIIENTGVKSINLFVNQVIIYKFNEVLIP